MQENLILERHLQRTSQTQNNDTRRFVIENVARYETTDHSPDKFSIKRFLNYG